VATSLNDYLAGASSDDFLRQAQTYSSNRDVLRALGAPDTEQKAGRGLLSTLLTPLGAPGRIIRGSFMEAIGRPSPELRATRGLEQLGKLASGEIQAGFGDMPGLQVNSTDKTPTRALKLAGAFIGDVATDPLSYIGAPGALSRKAAATILATQGKDILTSLPAKAAPKIDELVKQTPVERVAAIQRELGVTGAGTPDDLLKQEQVQQILREEALGNHLAQGILKGRKEVLDRLEAITGSKGEALSVFNRLPEEVRGGIVVTGLLGKPLKRSDGSFVRLTPGTGESLGKFGEVVNRGRLAASVAANPLTRITGKGGDIFAEVKKTVRAGEEGLLGKDRFIDYVRVRNLLGEKQKIRAALQGKALAATNRVNEFAKRYESDPAVAERYMEAYKNAFFSPMAVGRAADQVESDAYQAAQQLRDELSAIYDEAKRVGIEIGELGEENTFTPLVMTEDSVKAMRKREGARTREGEYSSVYGRDSFVEFIKDAEIRRRAGFQDRDNPGVVYLNAREVNRIMKERGDVRRFEEDPTLIYAKYAYDLANRIANKRFLDAAERSGVVIRDVPVVQRMLQEYNAATFMAALDNISPELKKQAQETLDNVARRMADSVEFKSLKEAQDRIREMRTKAQQDYDAAGSLLTEARQALTLANQDVARLAPRESAIRNRISELRRSFVSNQQELETTQRVARSLRARLGRAEANMPEVLRDTRNLVRRLQYARQQAVTPEEVGLLDELILIARDDRDAAVARLDELSNEKQLAEAELSAARATRDSLTSQEASTQAQAVTGYVDALERQKAAVEALEGARGARIEARKAWRNAESDIAFESVDRVDGMVLGYQQRLVEAKRAKQELADARAQLRARGVSKEAADELLAPLQNAYKLADDAAKSSRDALKKVLSYSSQRFEGVARDYADELFKLADELAEDEFTAAMLLKSEKKILEFIEVVNAGARDADEVLDAMGDMYRAYASIADKVDPAALARLDEKQQAVLSESGFAKLREGLFRDKKQASKLAGRIVDEGGYESMGLNKATADLYATKGVRKLMADIYKAEQDPSDWEKIVKDYLDPLLTLWKTSVTVGRGPGYVATNTIGGLWMNYLGNVSVRNQKIAGKVLLRINDNLKKIEAANPNRAFADNLVAAEEAVKKEFGNVKINGVSLYDIVREFFDLGGFFDTETQFALRTVAQAGTAAPSEVFRRTGAIQREFATEPQGPIEERYRQAFNFLLTNRVQRSLNNMAQSSEIYLRLGAFIDGFEKYKNFESAMANVHLLHFNYQDLSNFEQWVRRFVPFYTWSRNNVPAQMRALAMQPGKIQRAFYANQEFQNAFGVEEDESWMNQVLPEYLTISDGFASRFKFGSNNIGFFLRLPYEDINKLFQVKGGVPLLRGRELANMVGPFTTPLEIASGVDLATGAPFSPSGTAVPEYYNLLRFIPGSNIYRDAEGQLRASGAIAKGVQDIFPTLGVAERAVSGATVIPRALGVEVPEQLISKAQQERSLTDLLNVTGIAPAFGVSAVTLTPRSFAGELRGRTERQRGLINRLAASGNYDTDFIREQLRNGATPEEIAIMLQAGRGQAAETDNTESTLKPETRQRYLDSLRGL